MNRLPRKTVATILSHCCNLSARPEPRRLEPRRPRLEALEGRTLMSATPLQATLTQTTAFVASTPAAAAQTLPSANLPIGALTRFNITELRSAYGLKGLSYTTNHGNVPCDGRGQTIAIIDKGDDPYIFNELATFNQKMNLPGCTLTVQKEIFNGRAPAKATTGWAGEIAMDVEFAHAFAPAANIVLYEANEADFVGLYQCVDWARHAAGVTVVSMSFGIDGETSHEGAIDGLFTTPSGHAGVTFVASAGDHGRPSYPATSPNVLSVGGTQVTTLNGGLYTETVWNDGYDKSGKYWSTGGGYSRFEAEPSYQANYQRTGLRGAVDVALNAEANVWGYSVIEGGWQLMGGTSAAAPEMAGIVAVANQGRAITGRGSFAGVNAAIYALPSSDFHDITIGHNGYYSAFGGWDTVSGRGSPQAGPMLSHLANSNIGATPQYGVNSFVGVNALRQYSGYYFAASAQATSNAADHSATGNSPKTLSADLVDAVLRNAGNL